MKRLKQAIELARQERGAFREKTTDDEVRPGNSELGAPIAYTKTRVFRPDTKVLTRNRVITNATSDTVVAAYKVLRTQVLQRLAAKGWNTLAVTSPGSGEGKTLTAINVAISMAREINYTVILVDLDLHRPSVHRYFNYQSEYGICDFLLGSVPLSEILFSPKIDGLVVLPGNEPSVDSSELLSSPRMIRLVEELKNRYQSRIVLFDLPPLLTADDVLAFSPHVDAVLMVVEDGKTQRGDLSQSLEYLHTTNVLGTVLNNSKETPKRRRQTYSV